MSAEDQAAPAATDAWNEFVKKHSEGYALKCKDFGLRTEYTLDVDGKQVTYKRNRLKTRQNTDLEKTRQRMDREAAAIGGGSGGQSIEQAEKVAELYLLMGQAYLTNKETGQPLTKDEFENMIWEDIRFVIDSCHIRTSLGVPN